MLPDIAGDVVPRRSNLPRDHLRVPDANQDFRPPPPHHRHSTYSQDNDLSDTVANFVDFVKEGRRHHHRYRHNMHTRYRGNSKIHGFSSVFANFQFKITFGVEFDRFVVDIIQSGAFSISKRIKCWSLWHNESSAKITIPKPIAIKIKSFQRWTWDWIIIIIES